MTFHYDPAQSASVFDYAFNPEEGRERPTSLMRHYSFKTGRSVLITGGVAQIVNAPTPAQIQAADDGSGEGGKAFFRGGTAEVEVTAGEKTALEAAGFTVSTS